MLFKTIINHDKQFVVETSPISAALHQATPCSDSALWITFPASSRSRFSRASALSWRSCIWSCRGISRDPKMGPQNVLKKWENGDQVINID